MTILNADKWLTSTLKGDTAFAAVMGTRIYAEIAPRGTTYPLTTIQMVGPAEQIGNAYDDRIMDEEIWQIDLAAQANSYSGLEVAADRARALLHKTTGTGVIACVYAGNLRFAEEVAGVDYRHIILEFRILTQ